MRAILFDMDGVLVDSREVWYHCMQDAARHFGHPPLDRQAFLDSFGQGVDADIRTFFPGTGYQELDHFYDTRFADHREHFLVNDEAAPLFQDLAARGLTRVVVTNTSGPLARDILGWTGLEPDLLLGSTDVARPKPAPDLLLEALERLGAAPGEVLMVGDSAYDRQAAEAAGVRFFGFGGIRGEVTLERLGDLLEHLPGAAGGSPH